MERVGGDGECDGGGDGGGKEKKKIQKHKLKLSDRMSDKIKTWSIRQPITGQSLYLSVVKEKEKWKSLMEITNILFEIMKIWRNFL